VNDERGWRGFALVTMLVFFFGLLIFAAVFDAFLSRFTLVFLGLLCVVLIAYALVASILRAIVRVRRASHPDETDLNRPR
jgi:preprotein translocase subunit SecG